MRVPTSVLTTFLAGSLARQETNVFVVVQVLHRDQRNLEAIFFGEAIVIHQEFEKVVLIGIGCFRASCIPILGNVSRQQELNHEQRPTQTAWR